MPVSVITPQKGVLINLVQEHLFKPPPPLTANLSPLKLKFNRNFVQLFFPYSEFSISS